MHPLPSHVGRPHRSPHERRDPASMTVAELLVAVLGPSREPVCAELAAIYGGLRRLAGVHPAELRERGLSRERLAADLPALRRSRCARSSTPDGSCGWLAITSALGLPDPYISSVLNRYRSHCGAERPSGDSGRDCATMSDALPHEEERTHLPAGGAGDRPAS